MAKNFALTWDIVAGIMRRGVMRGLRRRTKKTPGNIGIDETSFQKRHEYVTVILDKDDGTVIDILDDRKANTLKTWFKEQRRCDFARINSISMDMWDPFINSVREHFERADELIAFDRFHVSQHFGKAVDKVRAEEHRALAVNGKSPLTRTRHQWLINSVGKMVRHYFWGILNAIRLKADNSMLESKNARIQRKKKTACGFRNKERFKVSILFHLGGLDIMPSTTR